MFCAVACRCHYWSNFEIADLRWFRSPEYIAYFDYLDKVGGFYYERWGDAPVCVLFKLQQHA
jgi:alpha 1,2-mannosyltransferase